MRDTTLVGPQDNNVGIVPSVSKAAEDVAKDKATPEEFKPPQAEFPQEGLPPGVVPPKDAKDLLDPKKWQIPEDTPKPFDAKGTIKDQEGQKPIRLKVSDGDQGKTQIAPVPARPETPQSADAEPEDNEDVPGQVEPPPAPQNQVTEKIQKYELQVKEGQDVLVDPKTGEVEYVLPLVTQWDRVSGEADVKTPHRGENRPEPKTPVTKITVNEYRVTTRDSQGKTFLEQTVRCVYQPTLRDTQ